MKISERVRNYPDGFRERHAARNRLPPWAKATQFLLLLVWWLLLGVAWFALFYAIYRFLHPAGRMIPSCAGVIAFSALFGTIPLALLAVNLTLYLIPQLRRANQTAAQGAPGMTFEMAMADLLSIAQISTPVCMIAGLVGAWGPWI